MENQQYQQTVFTISEAAKIYGKDRTTVFKDTKKENGLSTRKERRGSRDIAVVDLAELIRFYGEPHQQYSKSESTANQQPVATSENNNNQSLIVSMELKMLQEKLQHEQQLRELENNERQRENQQLKSELNRAIEQAEHWRKQAETQTKLLTDERGRAAIMQKDAQEAQQQALEELEAFKNQPKRKWWKLWG